MTSTVSEALRIVALLDIGSPIPHQTRAALRYVTLSTADARTIDAAVKAYEDRPRLEPVADPQTEIEHLTAALGDLAIRYDRGLREKAARVVAVTVGRIVTSRLGEAVDVATGRLVELWADALAQTEAAPSEVDADRTTVEQYERFQNAKAARAAVDTVWEDLRQMVPGLAARNSDGQCPASWRPSQVIRNGHALDGKTFGVEHVAFEKRGVGAPAWNGLRSGDSMERSRVR